jgi:diguanylate cyclase (GGDEF)-like protein
MQALPFSFTMLVMKLDIHTILVLFSVLALILSFLLALASVQTGNAYGGVKHWALASFCLGIGFLPAYAYDTPAAGYQWGLVFATTWVAAGFGLQYAGIRAFNGNSSGWAVIGGFVLFAFLESYVFSVVAFRPDLRSLVNSTLFGTVSLLNARLLFSPQPAPLSTACRFTGASFALMSLVFSIRAILTLSNPAETVRLYLSTPSNSLLFILFVVAEMCVTFGFVLMINYRLLGDIQKIASHDALTGIFSRRSLEEEAHRLLAHCARSNDVLSLMMIDVDHFKQVNDRYGHLLGDAMLRHLSGVIQASVRTEDFLARYGGEEFCVLMLSTTEQEASRLAERLRESYAASTMEVGGVTLFGTISIGVADSSQGRGKWPELLAAADKALYQAKQRGRNRVVGHSALFPDTTMEAVPV